MEPTDYQIVHAEADQRMRGDRDRQQAKEMARRWVLEQGSTMPGFWGAIFHRSTNWLAADALLPATSDVDVMVVLDDPNPLVKPGKFIYRDVMLEVSYLASEELRSPELILGQSHLAGSFHTASVILDPSRRLTSLQEAVSKDYAKRHWVSRRCQHARGKVLWDLPSLREADPFHDQVTAWLFATGVTTQILLVAGLENPTVRRRYVAVRELLADYGHLEFHETLLEMLGCAQMSRARGEHHLAALADAFDATKAVIETPFLFASDISDLARPIATDGTRELIGGGDHREAMFWVVATYARCQKVLHHDAPVELLKRFEPGFRELLGDLGITSFVDLQRRGARVRQSLPQIRKVAESIIAANPGIEN